MAFYVNLYHYTLMLDYFFPKFLNNDLTVSYLPRTMFLGGIFEAPTGEGEQVTYILP